VRIVTLTVLFCGLVGYLDAGDRIKINLRESDATIKQRLLGLTPLGTSAEAVFQFLQSRLERDKNSQIVGRPGTAVQIYNECSLRPLLRASQLLPVSYSCSGVLVFR
jgi:hypothetical protein